MLGPTVLLETSIAQLRTLASFLAEQIGTAAEQEERTAEARACKELLLSISVLLPKLQAAKYVLPADLGDAHCGDESPVKGEEGSVSEPGVRR
ncbi:MAG TPA: hypothetical protein VGN07_22565 [Steroidobacteraceae bacterium]|jgi:hypothetical protein